MDLHIELQYKIELFVDGMIDGPPSSVTAAERLQMLLDRRKAWAQLQWKERFIVPMQGDCQAYELVGGVFAKTMSLISPVEPSRHLTASWLPSSNKEERHLVRNDLGMDTRDFAMDPSQDLIIFLEEIDPK